MIQVKFYDKVEDGKLKFAVIVAKTKSGFVFCKHKDRKTLEVPGGRREEGEDILTTAKRELYEETGALRYDITSVGVYSVTRDSEEISQGEESFGMLYFATIEEFEKELHSEIEKIFIMDTLPNNWTYPLIQPKLMEYVKEKGFLNEIEKEREIK